MKNKVTVIKKKHCYKVEYKGQIRYCPLDKIPLVTAELLSLNGKLPKEIKIIL